MKAKRQVAPNLFIRMRASGNEYYLGKFKKGGRSYERSLGSTKDMTLRDAKFALARLMLEFDEKKPEEDTRRASGLSFKEAIELAMVDIVRVKQWKTDNSEYLWRRTLQEYAVPILGDINVADITRKDILKVLEPIWFNKTETANRVRMRIEAIMNWCIHNDYRKDSNPAVWRGSLEFDLPSRTKVQQVVHHEAMTNDEIKKVVAYCLEHPSVVGAAVLFGIATAARVSEFRFAKRSEIEGDVWLVPPERRKDSKRYPHRVPLSTLAKKALRMAKKFSKKDELFVTDFGLMCADSPRQKIKKIVGRAVTMHGCRSTFRDWCAENGIDRVLAEKSLMHATGNEVEQAYQRSDLLEQRREVMQNWADFLLTK